MKDLSKYDRILRSNFRCTLLLCIIFEVFCILGNIYGGITIRHIASAYGLLGIMMGFISFIDGRTYRMRRKND